MKLFLFTVSMIVVVTVNCRSRPNLGRPGPGRPDPGRPNPGRPDPGRPNPVMPGPGRPDVSKPVQPEPDTSCQCGVINTSRIVGGTEVNPKRKYPWQIGLVFSGVHIQCGGSIINDRWILTAAHCITDKNIIKYDKSSKLKVIVGEHNQFQTKEQDPKKKEYSIKTYIKHEDYNYETYRYDFALLELTEAIPFNNKIRPVCLPKDDRNNYVGQKGTVTGWGRTSTNGAVSNFLREVQVTILANNNCGNWPTLLAMKLCAGGEYGKDFCQGDSGGPLHVVENNKYVQVGVVSSYNLKPGCASAQYPGLYARVSKVITWITKTAKGGKKCD